MSDLAKNTKSLKEQIEYDGPERMDRDMKEKSLVVKLLFLIILPYQVKKKMNLIIHFAELLLLNRFKEVVERVKRYTGMEEVSGQNAFMQLQMMLMQAVQEVKSIESNNEGYLEQLAVDLVKQELSLPMTHFNMMLSYSQCQVK